MARRLKPIDITNNPEILRLVEVVRLANEPRVLRRADEDLAILIPIGPRRKRRPGRVKTGADYEAFRSAAGGWKHVDTDKLIADIYAGRALSNRSQTSHHVDVHDQDLIERYIDPEWDRYPHGRADARLKEYGVSVWALIGQLEATGGDLDQVAADYDLPREAVDAALAYYRQNKKYIDARLLLNRA